MGNAFLDAAVEEMHDIFDDEKRLIRFCLEDTLRLGGDKVDADVRERLTKVIVSIHAVEDLLDR